MRFTAPAGAKVTFFFHYQTKFNAQTPTYNLPYRIQFAIKALGVNNWQFLIIEWTRLNNPFPPKGVNHDSSRVSEV